MAPPRASSTAPALRGVPIGAERSVASVLPYLLLGPLAQLGYLDALGATLAAAEQLDALPLIAVALAFKVLPASARGWRRSPAAVEAAVVFAGLDVAPPEPALVDLARVVSPLLSPLDAIVAGALLQGHRAGEPFLLHPEAGASPGMVLLDVEGIFPIARAVEVEVLARHLSVFEGALVLVPGVVEAEGEASGAAFATPALLARLDALGLRFITDAPPTRGEAWRALRRAPAERFWTNDRVTPDAALLRAAVQLGPAAEMASATLRALAARPAVPLAAASELEASISLAAGVALGDIAFRLWREREPVYPLLALDRFANLEGSVRFERGSVRVRVPLGRRHQDLLRRGLLADVPSVPWLGGRALHFGGG
jgi:hypothetical protein